MKRESKRKALLLLAVAALVFLAALVETVGLLDGINSYLSDMSFRLRGPRPVSDRIVIIAVDEKTLERFGKWPIRRSYYARMLDALSKAEVVGFDLFLSDPSPDDALLAQAVGRNGKVVLPVYIERDLSIIEPVRELAPRRTGHVHVEHGVDNATRIIFNTLYLGGRQLPSLSSLMYEELSGIALKREPAPSGPVRSAVYGIVQRDPININYYGPPGSYDTISLSDLLDGHYPRPYFRGKAVLVGLTAPGIVDESFTPFNQDRDMMAGVEVHATALNNFLDKSSVVDVSAWVYRLTALCASLILTLAFVRLGELKALLALCLAVVVITVISFLLFSTENIRLSPAVFYFSFIGVFFAAYFFKLDVAAKKLDERHSAVIALLGSQAPRPTGQNKKTGISGLLSEGGINAKIERLLWFERHYGDKLQETVENKTRELTEALSIIATMSDELILRLTNAIELKDEGTGEHIVRVGMYATRLAEALGMQRDFIETIRFASALHDIGKIGIPDSILTKREKLTPAEMEVMKTHCVIGERILSNSPYPKLQMAACIALNHHEHWDGTGYPNGISGQVIPVEARILIICDCYDALRSKRHYKPALTHDESVKILTEGKGGTIHGHFDPEVLDSFVRIARDFRDIFDSHSI